MSSVFHEDLDEHSPLLPDTHPSLPSLQPQPTNATSITSMSDSRPPTPLPPPQVPVPSPQPSPGMSTTPLPPLSQPGASTGNGTIPAPDAQAPALPTPGLPKSTTNGSWGPPAGLPVRSPNDESLVIFRRALGINSDPSGTGAGLATTSPSFLESWGRPKRPAAYGIYADVVRARKRKSLLFGLLNAVLWVSYFGQVVVGAALTALGPGSSDHPNVITGLGVLNTVIAGFLALIKGQGLPERLRKDEMEFRRLQDWIEETEALLAVGVVGRDRKEVGLLVEWAFRKYNAVKQSEENNRPESYVPQPAEGAPPGAMTPRLGSGGSALSLSVPRY